MSCNYLVYKFQSSMGYSILLLVALVSTTTVLAQSGLVLPLRNDARTTQFYTTFQMGSNRSPINAVVHLSGQHLWFACDNYSSSTYAPILCGSAKCEAANGMGCNGCNGPRRPGCTNNTCGTASSNPFIPFITSNGFYEDTLLSRPVELPEFIFSCVPADYTEGLAAAAAGMAGFGRSGIAFHRVVAEKMRLPDRFSICPPSSGVGKLTIGGAPAAANSALTNLLFSTPLIVNKPVSNQPFFAVNDLSEEYFINVTGVLVGGVEVETKSSYFVIDKDRVGGTKISSVEKYTSMHTSIYKPMVRAFEKAATGMGMRSVAAVGPFRACYASESVRRNLGGPETPAVHLVLPSGKLWRISGSQLMVEVDGNTMCLAMVDAGSRPTTSIVIGTHQLVDHFLEFDVAAEELRLTASLLLQNKSCSTL